MLKVVAKRRGIDVSRLDNRQSHTADTQEKVGGEISTPCLPTIQKIMEDKQQLIEARELLQSTVTSNMH